MPSYLAPGIYVEEVPSGPRPIEGSGTSVAGFVGIAPDASVAVNEARWFDNWTQFARTYAPAGSASTPLSHAVFGFFENGGTRCCAVNVGSAGRLTGDGRTRQGLELLETFEDIAIVAAPGYADAGSYDALLSHCEKLRDRVAILDAPAEVDSIDSLTKVAVVSTKAKKEGDAAGAAAFVRESRTLAPSTFPGSLYAIRSLLANFQTWHPPAISQAFTRAPTQREGCTRRLQTRSSVAL